MRKAKATRPPTLMIVATFDVFLVVITVSLLASMQATGVSEVSRATASSLGLTYGSLRRRCAGRSVEWVLTR